MTRREAGFLLLGLGVGLIFSVVVIFYTGLLFHELLLMFAWRPGAVLIALPFALIFTGSVMLISRRKNDRAGMRIALALLALAVSAFCFLESAISVLITYSAYKSGQLRGVPFHTYALETALFLAATAIFYCAFQKLWPTRAG